MARPTLAVSDNEIVYRIPAGGSVIYTDEVGTELFRISAVGDVVQVEGTTLDPTLQAVLNGVTATAAELNTLAGVAAGTVTAGKAIVTTTSKHIDALVISDGGLALGAGAGTAVTSTAAELNILDGVTATADELNMNDDSLAFIDRLTRVRLAVATYDFAEHGGAISAISLGISVPDNAVVLDGMVDVITTCTTAGADAGTMALHIEAADDLVAAIAVSDGSNPWDVGLHAIKPLGTAATAIKTTAARAITATIAGQAFTDGKFVVFLRYVLSL